MNRGIGHENNMRQILVPFVMLLGAIIRYCVGNDVIESFYLSVDLWMIWRGPSFFDHEKFTNILHHFTVEISSLVSM